MFRTQEEKKSKNTIGRGILAYLNYKYSSSANVDVLKERKRYSKMAYLFKVLNPPLRG